MAWIKVDERFFSSIVVLRAGPLGAMLYLEALTYCMRFNLDVLPQVIVDTMWCRLHGEHAVRHAIAELEELAAFDPTEGGWFLNHYWVEDQVVIEGQGTWGDAPLIAAVRAAAVECAHCGSAERLEVDHIVPRSRGGYSYQRNLQVLCKPCNVKKSASVPWGALSGGRP